MDEVSKKFHLDRQTIYLLIEKGYLSPIRTIVYRDGRKNYFFKKDQVDNFRESFMFIKEAVIEYDIAYTKISAWIKEGKLIDNFQGVRNKYLIEKNQIEKLMM